MKISYGITVHNEADELNKLLKFLVETIREEDEIVICDDYSDGPTQSVIESYNDIKVYQRKLNGDFAAQKNSVIERASGEYLFHIDADEIPHKTLIEQLPEIIEMNDVDLIWIPRVNKVEDITDEHIQKWGWQVSENGWVNYPDYQSRVFRVTDEVRWINKVHEHITGCKTYAHLPPHEELSLYHYKTIEKQEQQNEFYSKL
jgi:glycosyltransferase involved in cell wall biosynthesis